MTRIGSDQLDGVPGGHTNPTHVPVSHFDKSKVLKTVAICVVVALVAIGTGTAMISSGNMSRNIALVTAGDLLISLGTIPLFILCLMGARHLIGDAFNP